MTDIAIAHKDYDTRGGGEVLVERMAELLDCPLYVGRYNESNAPARDDLDIREIPLKRREKWMIDRGGVTRAVAYMLAWQRAATELRDYDVVITSGNEPMWYVPPDEQVVIAYTHSTPRFMYDLYPDRVESMGWLEMVYYTGQRTVYQHNTARPDLWVANSDRVARRLERYQHTSEDDIHVVYPPVDTHNYDPATSATQDYYLHLGRLAGHKRVGDIVEAFNYLDETLVIAGDGPARDRLEREADGNIEFVGYVDEQRKQELMSGAKAQVYAPENEDFGMVPIESMAAGTPVIGVREGFTEYQIQDGKNGLLFDREGNDLFDAIQRFEHEGVQWSGAEIAAFAEQFNVRQFHDGLRDAIDTAVTHASVTPSFETAAELPDTTAENAAVPDGGESS